MDSSTTTLLLRLTWCFDVGGDFAVSGSCVEVCWGAEGFVVLEGFERVDCSALFGSNCCCVEDGNAFPAFSSTGLGKGDELESDLDWGTVFPDESSLSIADSIIFEIYDSRYRFQYQSNVNENRKANLGYPMFLPMLVVYGVTAEAKA